MSQTSQELVCTDVRWKNNSACQTGLQRWRPAHLYFPTCGAHVDRDRTWFHPPKGGGLALSHNTSDTNSFFSHLIKAELHLEEYRISSVFVTKAFQLRPCSDENVSNNHGGDHAVYTPIH